MNDDDLLSDEVFEQLSRLLLTKTGIVLKDYKKYLVVSRLSRVVGPGMPFGTFAEYYQALKNDPNLLQGFFNALTTNYSYFFRDPVHFQVMEQYLRETGAHEPYLRLWSAAGSTGEEAFSMAITLANHQGYLPEDRRILATDISTKVLSHAEKATYGAEAVQKHVSPADQKRYLTLLDDGKRYAVKPALRALVDIRQLNLLENFPFRKKMDIIFLRNVMIYFGPREKAGLVERVYEQLKPGGLLILGLSESLAGVPHRFTSYKDSVHQKTGA